MVKLLYFAALVDRLGTAAEEFEMPPGVGTVRDLLAALRQRGGVWDETFSAGAVRITVNKQFAELETRVADGDEIAFISARM